MREINRRFWSLLLTVALVLTMLPTTVAHAADTGLDTELVTNGGAESTDITGWIDDTGAGRWNSSTVYSSWALPAAGSKYFYLYNPNMDIPLSGTMSQEIPLSGTEGSGIFSAISAGNVSIQFSISMFQGIAADNEAKAILEEYSADGTLLKTSQAVNTASSGAMGSYQINTQVNPATREFKVILSATLTKGGYAQFDQVSLKLVDASTGSAPVFGSDFPASVETDAGVPCTANFTISDADAGDVDRLTFSAFSTNVNLVSAANITVSGSGGNRTLRIAPTGNLPGEADITVTASDGTKSAEKTLHFIAHKVISMDTNLVENGNGTNELAGWSGNTVNVNATGDGFSTDDPGSSMSQNIDISKFSSFIDGGETEFLLSAVFPSGSGEVTAQFYTDIACTNHIGSSFAANSSSSLLQQKIPAGAKGVKITFRNTRGDYNAITVRNISFQIVNNFPKISAVSAKTTGLNTLTVPVYAYYTTADATLTAKSSNQAVVFDGSISAGGSGFNRSVSFTPLQNGTATITLALNDGSKSVSSSFDVTAHEPAKVTSVTPPTAGFYGAGDSLDFTATFNYPVTGGTGSTLPLTIGGEAAAASYASSTSNSITYRYTVVAGDSGTVVVGTAIDDAGSPITGSEYDVETGISTAGATGVTVLQAPEVTSTAAGGATYGTKITFTAALNCAEPLSGTVQFKANGTDLGAPVSVSENSASYETAETELKAGSASISAEFIPNGADSHFDSLTSSTCEVNISRKAITIAPNPATKVDGTADPALDYQITGGALAASDSLAGSLSRAAGEDVGEYEITQGTVTNENNPNYDIAFVSGVKLTITEASAVNASISPATGSFDKKITNQADVQATITWGSATGITDVTAGGISIGADNYSVSGETLTINKGYLASQATGSLALTVFFDRGDPSTLTIDIIDTTSSAVSVTGITVTAEGGAESVQVGNTLQMQATVSPDNATNKNVNWSIKSGSGAAISASGLLTATAAGEVTVRATARDGSGVYGETTVTIAPAGDSVEISIAQSPVKTILHAITFGLFFDDTIDVSIASTGGTPDHYEYQTVADGNTYDPSGTWTQGNSFSVDPDFKGRVYARAVYSGGTTSAAAVKALVVDHTGPVITADYDASSGSIAVSVKDSGAGIGTVTYQVGSGTEQTIDLAPSETRDIAARYDFTIGGLPDGVYDVVINADDNSGNAAAPETVSIDRSPAVADASVSTAAASYDLSSPGDVKTNITWNSAGSVTGVVYDADSTPLTESSDYAVVESELTIKDDYLKTLGLSAGDSAEFTISFDAGSPVTFTVDFVDGYVPSGNADLSSLMVNGTTVTGFDPDTTEYDVELPYGTASAAVIADADDPYASVDITQASSLPGTATIEVTAEDSSTTKTYTIRFTIGTTPDVPATKITVTGADGADSVQVGNTLQMLATVSPDNATNKNVDWSIESGSGADIDASGLLTATAAGEVTVRATARDGSGEYGETTVTVTDTAPTGTVPAITTESLPGGMAGVAYHQTLAATGGAPITWTIVAGSLPVGLSFNVATGVISGTPTASGTFSFTVTASNAEGSDTKALNLTVSPSEPGTVSNAIAGLSDSSTFSEVASVVSQVLALPPVARAQLKPEEIQHLENYVLSAAASPVTLLIPSPETGGVGSSELLPAPPAATGLLLAAQGAVGSDPVTIQLTTTQKPAAVSSLVTFDLTMTRKVGDNAPETIHTALPFPVTITLPLPANFVPQAHYTYEIVHTRADATREHLPMAIGGSAGHYIATFTTFSFSTFSIVGTYNGSSQDSHHNSGESNSGSETSITTPAAAFTSDTTADFSVSGDYQFKITSKNGSIPTFVLGTPGIFSVRLVSVSGNDYYFRVTTTGAPGSRTGVYIDGSKLLVLTVGPVELGEAVSDTTGIFDVQEGKKYQFKIVSDRRPVLIPGSSSFRLIETRRVGNEWYFQFVAAGRNGEGCGFYLNGGTAPVAIAEIR